MPTKIEVDQRGFKDMLKQIQPAIDKSWTEAGDYYRSHTPHRSGNAQTKTTVNGNQIKADYAYAARLDEGWSNQAPNGMSSGTVDEFVRQLNINLGKL